MHSAETYALLARLADLASKGGRVIVHVTIIEPEHPSEDERLTVKAAAVVACTSARVIANAIRAGELPASGKQRDRSIKRSDLDAWIASRSVRLTERDDADIAARVARLEVGRAKKQRGGLRSNGGAS